MTREKVTNLKRIKNLFLEFLKQFQVEEYKLLMQFLQLLIDKYNSNPATLFGFLTSPAVTEIEECCASKQAIIHKQHLNPKSSKNRRYQQQQVKRSRPQFSSPLIYAETQLDEEMNIKFDDNDDDTDIDYLDENYNEPLGPCSVIHNNTDAFNLEMLKDRTDILDSFIMKPKDEAYSGYELGESDNSKQELIDNDELYYENYEDEAYEDEYLANENEKHRNQQHQYGINFGTSTYLHHQRSAQYFGDRQQGEFIEYQIATGESPVQCVSHKTKTHRNKQFENDKNNNESERKVRVRKFSEAIRSELERKFLLNNFISGVEKAQLARKLELTERQVQKWFVHRREKLRRLEKKSAVAMTQIPQEKKEKQSESADDDDEEVVIKMRQTDVLSDKECELEPRDKDEAFKACSPVNSNTSSRLSHRPRLDYRHENPYKKFYLTRVKSADQTHLPLLNLTSGERDKEYAIKEEAYEQEETHQHESSVSYLNESQNIDEFMYDCDETNSLADDYDLEANSQENLNESTYYQDLEENTTSLPFLEDTDEMAYSQFIVSNFEESSNQQEAVEQMRARPDRAESAPMSKRKCLSVPRRLFPPQVVEHLESLFDTGRYIKENQIEEISRATNLNEKQIRSWFKQRRFRYNLENKEKDQDFELNHLASSLSKQVVIELEKAFQKNNYVYGNDKKNLSRQLNLTPIELERWFYHRRRKVASNSERFSSD